MDPRDFVKKLEEAKKLPAETKVWKWSTKARKGAMLAGGGGGSNPGKLLISNLEADMTKGALINLFGQEGQLQSASLHYGRQGKSLGMAVVIFNRRRRSLNIVSSISWQRRMIMVGDGMVEARGGP